jgi:hypothetical protein
MAKSMRSLKTYARRVTRGQRDSSVFLQIWNDKIRTDPGSAPEVLVQLGYSLVLDKPIVVIAPHDAYVPDSLRRAACAVERFDPEDTESMKAATLRALKAAKKHEDRQ